MGINMSKTHDSHPGVVVTGVYTLVFLYLVYSLGYVVYALLFHPLRRVPGPFLARFTRFWEVWALRQGRYNERLIQLHEQHGRVVRLAPNRYSFNSPDDVKAIYAIGSGFDKSEYYDPFGDPHSSSRNMLNLRDEKEHSRRKRLIANLYSMSTMVNYEEAVETMNQVLVDKLHQFAASTTKMPVSAFMQFYAFDVIGQISWDSNFAMVQCEKDTSGVLDSLTAAFGYQTYVGLIPEFHTVLSQMLQLLPSRDPAGLAQVINNQIAKFRSFGFAPKENPKSEPFLSKLIALENNGKMDTESFFDSVGSNIAAGSDTTGVTLSAAFYHLYRNPDKLAALRQEIDTMTRDGRVSDPITFDEAQKMPYLQAVIKEVLRIHPAIGVILPREVPRGGAELAGYYFPEKTNVGVSAWSLHYNPDVIPQPEQFRPERWLHAQDAKDGGSAFSHFSFGGGSRACIGKNISLLEITKLIPQVVQRFDLSFEDPQKGCETESGFFVWPVYHCGIRVRAS